MQGARGGWVARQLPSVVAVALSLHIVYAHDGCGARGTRCPRGNVVGSWGRGRLVGRARFPSLQRSSAPSRRSLLSQAPLQAPAFTLWFPPHGVGLPLSAVCVATNRGMGCRAGCAGGVEFLRCSTTPAFWAMPCPSLALAVAMSLHHSTCSPTHTPSPLRPLFAVPPPSSPWIPGAPCCLRCVHHACAPGVVCGPCRKHVAAYLMLVLGGNASPAAADIKNVLDAAGIASDDSDIERLLAAVEGKVCCGCVRGLGCRGIGLVRGLGWVWAPDVRTAALEVPLPSCAHREGLVWDGVLCACFRACFAVPARIWMPCWPLAGQSW